MADELAPKVWKPTPKQEAFASLPDSIFEALYGGSVFSGKSELLVLLPLIRRFHLHPKFKGIILRRTFPELEKEIINRSFEYYGAAEGTYNKQEKKWRFPSGAQMYFGHAENESDIRRYDGVEYNLVMFDELESFTEFQYLYLTVTRCRSSSPELPAIVRSSAMPGNIGHAWVRKRFVDPYPEGNKILVDKKTGFKRFFLPSKPTDNPYGMRNDPGYIQRLELLPEAERRAKLGDWYTFTGQVFDNFRIEPLSDEPPNARHVVEPFAIPDFWPKVNMTDWGYTANTASLWGAISPDGRVYIYREYIVSQTDVAVWGTEIGDLNRADKNLRVVGIDTNAWEQRGEEETIADQFIKFSGLNQLGLALQPASKGRISGKILIQEYLRWKQRPKVEATQNFNADYAASILRSQGQKAYESYINQFAPQQEEANIPKLQIFSSCTHLISTIPNCVYDENNKEDVAEFPGDDVYDCLRYLLKAIVKYLDESKDEFSRLQKLSELDSRLAKTNNYTAYALIRQVYDSTNRSKPISRFHKGKNVRKMPDIRELFGF